MYWISSSLCRLNSDSVLAIVSMCRSAFVTNQWRQKVRIGIDTGSLQRRFPVMVPKELGVHRRPARRKVDPDPVQSRGGGSKHRREPGDSQPVRIKRAPARRIVVKVAP